MTESLQLVRADTPLNGFISLVWQDDAFRREVQPESGFFSEAEWKVIRNFRYERRRESFLLGRVAAKQALLAMYPPMSAAAIEIHKGVFEQPLVSGVDAEVSIAHSNGLGLAVTAPSGHLIGVDLERIGNKDAEVLRSSFSPNEAANLPLLSPVESQSLFCGWTIKEALSKAIRCGLMTPFPVLEISEVKPPRVPWEPSEVRFTNFAQYKALMWILDPFSLSIAVPARTSVNWRPSPSFLAELKAGAAPQ